MGGTGARAARVKAESSTEAEKRRPFSPKAEPEFISLCVQMCVK